MKTVKKKQKKKSRLFEKGRNVVIKNGSGGRRGGEMGRGMRKRGQRGR